MVDAYQRREQMFPILTQHQVKRIAEHGQTRRIREGEVLYEQGAKNTRFFVVLSGAIAIVRPTCDSEELITVHKPGEFTGETDMLSGRHSLVCARADEDSELIELDRDHLRALVQTDAELSEILMRAFILRRVGLIEHGQGDVALIGSRYDAGTLRIKEFLSRNGHPHAYLDVEIDSGVQAVFDRFHIGIEDVPVVICRGEIVLKNPDNQELARTLGITPDLDQCAIHDVVIVGAGPAGLASAVYAASEGLDVLVLETTAPGGQAGSSSKIENYLGFPTGISGQALAGRANMQAQKFGAELAVALKAVRLHCDKSPYQVELQDGRRVGARTVVIATGAQYRKLPLEELPRFEGTGIYYGATHIESQLCEDEEVIVVGGGNSAGQAAVFLAGAAKHVHILVRSDGLAATMSRYLIRRIEEHPKITLHTRTQIVSLQGDKHLESVCLHNAVVGDTETRGVRHVFIMTGAAPHTHWLMGCIALDEKNFVKTGLDLDEHALEAGEWARERRPHLLETNRRGIFAVGDVRSGSVKRVAAAVGEGSACVQMIHKVLQE